MLESGTGIILAVIIGLIIIILVKYFSANDAKRDMTLIKSFEEYAKNYTSTWDGFASNLVCNNVIHSRKTGQKPGNLCVIGAGPKPEISKLIKCFDKIYLVEPNDLYLSKWKQFNWHANKNVIIIHDILANMDKHINSNDVKFEWIIVSHVFYYIKKHDLSANVSLINEYLASNGTVIISVAKDNECDIAKLANYVQPEYQLCKNIIHELNNYKMKYVEIPSTEEGEMPPQNKESLMDIMSMHLSDYIIGNDEYDNIVTMDKDTLRDTISKWIDNNMKVDPDNSDNVIYYQHTAHYVVNKGI